MKRFEDLHVGDIFWEVSDEIGTVEICVDRIYRGHPWRKDKNRVTFEVYNPRGPVEERIYHIVLSEDTMDRSFITAPEENSVMVVDKWLYENFLRFIGG